MGERILACCVALTVNSTGIASTGTGSSSYVDGSTRFINYVVCVK